MACSSPPEVYLVAAPQARSVMMIEWEFLWSCQVLWNDAGELALVVGLIVGDANPLGKKARVVGKVECAR